MKRALGLILTLSLAGTAAAQDAEEPTPQGWEVCNETSYILRMATATMLDGTMTPRGWTRLRPGQCFDIDAPPETPRYVYAESSTAHQGGVREWKGEVTLCADDEDFKADATVSCPLQNLKTRQYLQVAPDERTTTFIEPDNYGDKAELAGLQRLLRDNGYKVSRLDGIDGRRTRNTLSKAMKDLEVSNRVNNSEKIDALAKSAEEKQTEIGLTLCNSSSDTVWTAVAFREDGEWESRGWWPVKVDACLRPFTKTLMGTDAHFFALQEDNAPPPDESEDKTSNPDKRLRSVSATPSQFCIAEARFSASGRELCADRGYVAANFRPLPTDADGAKVTLSDADFVAPSTVGLRR